MIQRLPMNAAQEIAVAYVPIHIATKPHSALSLLATVAFVSTAHANDQRPAVLTLGVSVVGEPAADFRKICCRALANQAGANALTYASAMTGRNFCSTNLAMLNLPPVQRATRTLAAEEARSAEDSRST